jgi:hypothetical protein
VSHCPPQIWREVNTVVECYRREKTESSEKILSHCHPVDHKSDMNSSDNEIGPPAARGRWLAAWGTTINIINIIIFKVPAPIMRETRCLSVIKVTRCCVAIMVVSLRKETQNYNSWTECKMFECLACVRERTTRIQIIGVQTFHNKEPHPFLLAGWRAAREIIKISTYLIA